MQACYISLIRKIKKDLTKHTSKYVIYVSLQLNILREKDEKLVYVPIYNRNLC